MIGNRSADNLLVQRLAHGGRQFFRVIDVGKMCFMWQDDSGDSHRPCKRSAPCLIHARNDRASRLCGSTLICIHPMQSLTFLLCPFIAAQNGLHRFSRIFSTGFNQVFCHIAIKKYVLYFFYRQIYHFLYPISLVESVGKSASNVTRPSRPLRKSVNTICSAFS